MSVAPAVDIALSTVSIYALRDPFSGSVRYVGQSVDLRKRFVSHRSRGKTWTHPVALWTRELADLGLEPDVDVLEVVGTQHADHTEREYIAFYRDIEGSALLNVTDGGIGGAMPPEIAKAAGLKRRGRRQSDSERQHRQQALQAHWDPDHPDAKERRLLRGEQAKRLGLTPPVRRGEDNNFSKFTEAQVIEIRERHFAGESLAVLAKAFNTSRTQVSFIVTAQTWKHVGGPTRAVKGKTRLSEDNVQEICRRLKEGELQSMIALAFGVSPTCVSDIRRGKRHKSAGGSSTTPPILKEQPL